MRYGSVCSGIEAATVAFEPLGWEAAWLAEIEPFPSAVLAHHYPDVPNLGDMTTIAGRVLAGEVEAPDMFCGGTPCFAAGQMVLTHAGYVPIESVRPGDLAMTHSGRLRKVLRVGSKAARVGVLWGVGLPEGITCTKEHPFRSVQFRRQSTRRNGVYTKVEHLSEPEWTPAREMPGKQWCALLNYNTTPHSPRSNKFDEATCMYLAGFYLGDGWTRSWTGKKKMTVMFGINAAKYELLKPWLGDHAHTISHERTAIKVSIHDTDLAKWLISEFGKGSHDKVVPAWVMGHPHRNELLRGYLDTDGCALSNGVSITTTSRALAYGACDLLNAEGYSTSVAKVDVEPTTVIEGRTVNQSTQYQVRGFFRSLSRKSRERHGMLLRGVSAYVDQTTPATVYNIEVEEDNSYILDGAIVHNCQSFSVAGLRKGLEDDRGNLTLQFVKLANAIDHIRSTAGREPAWVLWENVPGVLNTHDNSFGAFLGGLCGRDEPIPQPTGGWTSAGVVDGPTRVAAWRTLNAEHFGLAQRRKRIFVLALGGPGRWAAADALLPIIESSRWHPAPSRGKGKGTARGAEASTRGGGTFRWQNEQAGIVPDEVSATLKAKGTTTDERSVGAYIAHTLRGEGFDASEDGTGRGIPLVTHWPADLASTLDAHFGDKLGLENQHVNSGCPLFVPAEAPMLIRMREGKEGGGKGPLISKDQSLTLATANDQVLAVRTAQTSANGHGVADDITHTLDQAQGQAVMRGMQVRRLVPTECEALQGFPRNYTNIPWRGKDHAPDGPRYKALGNSWAVPCAKYIAERIQAVTKPTT